MKTKLKTRQLVLAGLLTAILIIFSFTPIGTIPFGPLSITLNIIPIAIAAISLGPAGGAVIGAIFGILSYLQCFGIGVPSPMGAVLVDLNPFFAFIVAFVPRVLDGLFVGLIFRLMAKVQNMRVYHILSGTVGALFAVALFMSVMLLLFYDTSGEMSMSPGMYSLVTSGGLMVYICVFVAILGFIAGYLFASGKKLSRVGVACSAAGFCAALFNTVMFMSALVLLYGNTVYLRELMNGRNVFIFIASFVGINALFEMVVSTVVTGAVGGALNRAKLLNSFNAVKQEKKEEAQS